MILYAKSPQRKKDGSISSWPTLEEHTNSVCDSARALLGERGSPTRLAKSILRFFKLTDPDFDALWLNMMVAAALHDIGKANDGFQGAVGNSKFSKCEQAIRHEHLSALWIVRPAIANWLRGGAEKGIDFDLILAAIAGHHLKARRDGTAIDIGFAGQTGKCQQCRAIPEGIQAILTLASDYLGNQPPELKDFQIAWQPGKSSDRDAIIRLADLVIKKELEHDEHRRRLLLAIRGLLIAADAAGSGLVREGIPVTWIKQYVLQSEPLSGEYIQTEVIDKRITQLENRWRKEQERRGEQPNAKFSWTDFQKEAASLNRRALLLAACGTGKTLAAWQWIKAQLDHERALGREFGRVLFLYPTRGTATEGFRDYVSWAPDADATLVHGTAAYDLANMFTNPEESDERRGQRYVNEKEARLFALAQWPKRIFSATVDAFLGAMANQYSPICLLPVLADSIVVIDEVHSFSESMFSSLRCFLKHFDAPVLCMTASLPKQRREILQELGLELFPRDPKQFVDLSRLADHPRYRVYSTTREQAKRIVDLKAAAGKRILWVVNRVDECQRLYREVKMIAPPDIPVFCYHSRFRLCDRRDRHNEVVEEFQCQPRRAAIAITTQVCEMSLDLDADMLISEIAPVTALIQRAGRCCRKQNPGKRFGEIYLYDSGQDLPYEKDEMDQGRIFRDDLVAHTKIVDELYGAVSQTMLADHLASFDRDVEAERRNAQSFWNSGFWAFPTEFREGEEFTIDCVLEGEDVEKYLAARKQHSPETPKYIVPVPRKLLALLKFDSRLQPLMIAPNEFYNPQIGYFLPEVNNGQA